MRWWQWLVVLCCGLWPVLVGAQVPAFPGAEGFGAKAVGGRGGRTIEVTTLADSGAGSLREALSATGPRIVVFRVSGTIALASEIYLREEQSYLTLAGQSAPGCGVQVVGNPVMFMEGIHDIIVRHMRFRIGAHAAAAGIDGIDAINVDGTTTGKPVYNVILDHSDFQWATDENCDMSYNTTDVTLQWSICAEGAMAGHTSGDKHSMGVMIVRYGQGEGQEQRVSVHHTLIAKNVGRNPRIGTNYPRKIHEQLVDFRNNLIFSPGGAQGAMEIDHLLSDDGAVVPLSFGTIARVNVVNNIFGAPASYPRTIGYVSGPSKIYLEGNVTGAGPVDWAQAFIDGNDRQWSSFATRADYEASSPHPVATVGTTATAALAEALLPRVGATVPKRDALDERIIGEVRANAYGVGIGSSLPELCGGQPPQDSDHDGMPDTWERAHGLNPTTAADGAALAASGYSNVEVYLNELGGMDGTPVRPPLPAPRNLRVLAVGP